VYGGSAGQGDTSTVVSSNRVRIIGGRVEEEVYGGRCLQRGRVEGSVYGGDIRGNASEKIGKVEGNKVEIISGEIKRNVYGGSGPGGRNVVELKGSPKFGKETMISGGGGEGNTLNIETREQVVVYGIRDFENYNFNRVRVNEPARIKVVGATNNYVMGIWRVDLEKVKVVGRVEGEGKEGEIVNLIEAEDGVTQAKSIELYKGGGLVKLSHERVGNPKELSLEIKGKEATPQAQKLNEVGATGMIIVGEGLGFLSEKGIEEAVGAVKGKTGAELFVGVGGESSKYKSGIEMRIEGVRAVGGIAKSMKEREVVIGGYVEHGKGDYKVEEVEGKGMSSYVGVGGLGRVKIGEGLYIDMSMGVGRQGVEFESKGLNVLAKEDIGYEYRSMYVGGHVGCGYKREVGEKVNIEVGGKVLLMRQEGKKVEMTNGAPVEIEGATSGKIKGLVRAGYKSKEGVEPYVGVGYEYELMGRGKGKVEGVELKEVDIKGGIGIGEVGVSGEVGDINIKISGRGYIGEREGVEGMVKVGYSI
jgi:hypothetical protein